MLRMLVELRRIGVFPAEDIARVFDYRALHAEADAEERYLVFSGVFDCGNLAFYAARSESSGNENAVDVFQRVVFDRIYRINRIGEVFQSCKSC